MGVAMEPQPLEEEEGHSGAISGAAKLRAKGTSVQVMDFKF